MLNGELTISCGGRGRDKGIVYIELLDDTSRTCVAGIAVPEHDFVAALGRLARVDCRYKHGDLSRVGKQQETIHYTFEVRGDLYDREDEELMRKAVSECPKGWVSDKHFGSQNSFFRDGDKQFANCVARRWVDIPPADSAADKEAP